MTENARPRERIYRGSGVSGGVSQGRIVVVAKQDGTVPRRDISGAEVDGEIERFRHALVEIRQQVLEVQHQVATALSADDASIFDAHLLALEDPTLIDEVTRSIRVDHVNAEHAYHEVSERYARSLDAIEDDYLRERAADMRDVASRVLNKLLGRDRKFDPSKLTEPCLLVSDDLSPSDTAVLDKKIVLGFATHAGSRTSHSAIMARSLQIPAIVGLHGTTEDLVTGEYALLDGFNGLLIVNPTDQTLFEYGQLVRKQVDLQEKLRDVTNKPAVTLDGLRFSLLANIEKPADADAVVSRGAEGVGLFRTEYLFLQRDSLPTEDEQFEAYREVAQKMAPRPVVIRTLDLGGDKVWLDGHLHRESNPFLGWRAIRLCLDEKKLFRSQLRAILRASAHGNVRILYPMICIPEELDAANAFLEECKAELRAEGQPFNENIEVGVMIEIPSAALMAGTLAAKVKFFSIGTNDLTQYTLAVDRLNDRIAHLYEPANPAVLRLIQMTVEAARPFNVTVCVCGEMAGDPVMVPLLLGLGVDELSASPALISPVKFLIRRLKMEEARKLAATALLSTSATEVLERSRALAREIAPSLFESQI
jgi:phosphoenolpyruvate-protein phosphotransferase (PTS system enzyme I)